MRDAKEKAKELIDEFGKYSYCFLGSGMLTNTFSPEVSIANAKRCALVCVDEILSEYSVLQIETSFCFGMYKWWSEVKKEIEEYES